MAREKPGRHADQQVLCQGNSRMPNVTIEYTKKRTLTILEALLKWEDKLLGYHIHVVMDHKALEFFQTQSRLTARQMRWIDYLARFDFDIRYIRGTLNKVAECAIQIL